MRGPDRPARLRRIFRLSGGLIAAFAPVAGATRQSSEPPGDPGEVVVLGSPLALPPGTPAFGASVIDRDRLTLNASGRVEDVLADVAGVRQYRRADSRSANPSAQGLTVRSLGGNATSRALVLLDGVPIADPFFGSIPFAALSADRLGAVRVTRGGGTGAFGAGAVAGTVELLSVGRAQASLPSAELFGGSFGSVEAAALAMPSLGRGELTLFARGERSDGFPTTPEAQRVAATVPAAYRDASIGLRAVVPVGQAGEMQVAGLAFADHRTLRFRGADSYSTGQDASVRLVWRGGWQVDALAYLQARGFGNKVVSATTFRVPLDQRRTPSTGSGGKIEVRPLLGSRHIARIGVDVRRADGELFETAYGATGSIGNVRNAGGDSIDTGLFAEDDWSFGPLVATGGVRIDRWRLTGGFQRDATAAGVVTVQRFHPDRAGTIATGRGGLLWHARPTLDLRASAYTGLRVPTLNELYRSYVVFPVTIQANPALIPERLRGAEAGVQWRPAGGMSLTLTGFANRLADAVANVTIAPNLRQRRNVAAIRARGIEAGGEWRAGPWSLAASYAFTDARVAAPGTDLEGFRPAQSPRHDASVTLGWRRAGGAAVSTTLRRIGLQYEDDRETAPLPAATTVDAVAAIPVARRWRVVARLENAFDTDVVTRNSGGTIDLGAPRIMWLGLRLAN